MLLILELQSSLVRTSLVISPTGKKGIASSVPEILYEYSVPLRHRSGHTSAHLIATVLSAIKEATEACLAQISYTNSVLASHGKKQRHGIESIQYVLSSPWIVSHARTLSHAFAKPVRLTEEVMEDILVYGRELYRNRSSKGLVAVEEKVFDVRVQGYSIERWQGHKVTDLEVSVSVGMMPQRLRDRLVEAVGHIVPGHDVAFHTALMLQSVVTGDRVKGHPFYGLVHVHGLTTDVAIFKRKGCVFVGSYPIGIEKVLKRVLQGSKGHAESILMIHSVDHFDPSHGKTARRAVSRAAEEWADGLQVALKKITLPPVCFVSAGQYTDFFTQALQSSPLAPSPVGSAYPLPSTLAALYAAAIHMLG